MEIYLIIAVLFGGFAGHSYTVKKCAEDKKWCAKAAGKIQPAEESKSDGE